MNNATMPKADFISGLILLVLSVYIVHAGLQMPGAGGFIEKGGEPGRAPIMLGSVLGLFSLVLIVRSVLRGGHRIRSRIVISIEEKSGYVRCALTAIGCSVYALGLLGSTVAGLTIRYDIATAIFLFGFIVAAEWQEMMPNERLKLVVTALLQAIAIALIVTYVFEQEFYVKLP